MHEIVERISAITNDQSLFFITSFGFIDYAQ